MPFLFIILISLLSTPIESFAQNISASSAEENLSVSKTVLYIFTGSDWCADCRRLGKNVLNDSTFVKSMELHKIGVEIIDFPQRKKLPPEVVKYNESIAETYDFQGIFPTLILSQAEGNYEVLNYKNEKAAELSEQILEKLKYLNE